MARLAEIGLRPIVGFAAKNMPWRPVMILRTLGVADLAKEMRCLRAYVGRIYTAVLNNFSLYEVLRSSSAVEAHERVFIGTASVSVITDEPTLRLPAFLTRILRIVDFIFPRGICHEKLPILRKQ